MSGSEMLLPILIGVAAFLYASVGHAGASGYLAAMAFCGVSAAVMKPSALLLNLVVASLALFHFARAGRFSWRRFWPFALGSIPLAYWGGTLHVPSHVYRVLIGATLLVAAVKVFTDSLPQRQAEVVPVGMPPILPATLVGTVIGVLAGMTGTGGGIFLSPVLVLLRWGEPRDTGGVAAAFILANSLAGLAGHLPTVASLHPQLPLWIAIVLLAGTAGAWYGSRRATSPIFRRLLSVVLAIAGGKLLLT
jgi:uncharacterized membrane protein YfcA